MVPSIKVRTETQKRNPSATFARALNAELRVGDLIHEKMWSPCVFQSWVLPLLEVKSIIIKHLHVRAILASPIFQT